MRALFAGEEVTHHGLVTRRPGSPVDAAGARRRRSSAPRSRRQTAGWVGGWADGLITVGSDPAALRPVLDAFREGGGDGKPAYLQVHLSWAPTDDEARAIAHDQWRTNVFPPPVCWDLDRVEQFDEAARFVTADDVASRGSASSADRRSCSTT